MTSRLARAAVALAAALVATVAPPATAQESTWTVTPGGAFHGTASETVIIFQGSGPGLTCSSSTMAGTAKSGTGLSNPLITLPPPSGLKFNNCQGPFGLTIGVIQRGTWSIVCHAYVDGVAYCRIINIVFDFSSPSCVATITGYLNVTYTHSTGVWRILPEFTLTVGYVSPSAGCLGLIRQGQHVAVSAEFVASPRLTITSP